MKPHEAYEFDPAIRRRVLTACLRLIADGHYPGHVRLRRLVPLADKTVRRVRDRLVADGLLRLPPVPACTSPGTQRAAWEASSRRASSRRAATVWPPRLGLLPVLNAADAAAVLPRSGRAIRRAAYADMMREGRRC